MTIGSLTFKVVLDHPRKIYFGSSEPVTGNVVLQFHPESSNPGSSELFGPLKAAVRFHGRAKTKITKRRGNSRSTYRGRANMFSEVHTLHEGPFKVHARKPAKIPFAIQFANQSLGNGGDWEEDARFHRRPGAPLPPTFSTSHYGFSAQFEAFVEYRIGASVAMPQIDVKIFPLDAFQEPLVYYEQPRTPRNQVVQELANFSRTVVVQNEFLLPQEDRPSGFKQKAKAVFKSDYYPKFQVTAVCMAPRHAYLGQPLALELRVNVHAEKSTAILVPDVIFGRLSVNVVGHTVARSEYSFISSHESSTDDTNLSLSGTVDIPGAFSKAHGWTKTVNTPLLATIQSSFCTYNISRSYSLVVRYALKVTDKLYEWETKFPLIVHPMLENMDGAAFGSAQAGSSAQGPLDSMGDVEAALPTYDGPPAYEQVADDIALPYESIGKVGDASASRP